jgi:5-carboxymethyl-2-hydroxymuconate isomerase
MPHITLEISDNLAFVDDRLPEFFGELHKTLVSRLGVDLLNCKSRLVRHKSFYVADGKPEHAFAHLEIKIMEGRSTAEIGEVGNAAMEILQKSFEPYRRNFLFQPSVEIINIGSSNYFKLSAEDIKVM